MKAAPNQGRNYALDFIKCLATITIVFHHYQQITGARFRFNFDGGWFYWGHIVELFFLISGYVMYRYVPAIYEGRISLKVWTAKRTLRCIPLMAIGAVAYELILYLSINRFGVGYHGIQPTIWGTVVASLGLQQSAIFPNPWVNNPTWYISVLFLCYIVFYIATALAKKWNVRPSYLYIAIILLGCGIATYGINTFLLDSQTARGYRAFFFGVLLAGAIAKNDGKPSAGLWISSLVTLVLFALALIFKRSLLEDNRMYLLTFLVFPAMIVLLSTPAAKKLFSGKIWSVWGGISFNVYIWHEPMLVALNLLFGLGIWPSDFSRWEYMLIFTLAAEIVGVISHYLIEKPLARRVNRMITHMEAADANIKNI